jgi:hypothetical protein
MSSLSNITSIIPFFTNKAKSQVDSFTNSANLIRTDARNLMCVRSDYEFGVDNTGQPLLTPEVAGNYIGIIRLKDGADIHWHNIEVLVNTAAGAFICEIGLLSDEGVFTAKATMGAAVNNISSAVVPGPYEPLLNEAKWVVAKILEPAGAPTVPTSGKVSFYVPYVALT